MKNLKNLTYLEYSTLQNTGMLFVVYPEATGSFRDDCEKAGGDDISKVETDDLIK